MIFNTQEAIFKQIANLICEKILSLEIKQNEKIPSVRQFAAELMVNPNTVMRTYEYLQTLGIITSRRGLGLFVSERGFEKTLNYKREELIERDLPYLFKKIILVNMQFTEIENIFKKYRQNDTKD